jgi:hypothetical protein
VSTQTNRRKRKSVPALGVDLVARRRAEKTDEDKFGKQTEGDWFVVRVSLKKK